MRPVGDVREHEVAGIFAVVSDVDDAIDWIADRVHNVSVRRFDNPREWSVQIIHLASDATRGPVRFTAPVFSDALDKALGWLLAERGARNIRGGES